MCFFILHGTSKMAISTKTMIDLHNFVVANWFLKQSGVQFLTSFDCRGFVVSNQQVARLYKESRHKCMFFYESCRSACGHGMKHVSRFQEALCCFNFPDDQCDVMQPTQITNVKLQIANLKIENVSCEMFCD